MRPSPAALASRLREAGCVFAEDEAGLLLAAPWSDDELEVAVTARVSGTPLELVLGWADFDGLRMVVEPGVFVPRQRTLLMVTAAAAYVEAGQVVVDLCCGTGALGRALGARVPGIELYAADLDPAAVHCARRNLPKSAVFEGDLYAALPPGLRGRVQVLLANTPYVPTAEVAHLPPEARDHEHHVALDGGPDGLDVQRRVLADAPLWLAPGGRVWVESGEPQVPTTVALMEAAGLTAEVVRDDETGGLVVAGRRTSGV